jgi:hypothetical protein
MRHLLLVSGLMSVAMLVSPALRADGLAGFWQHEEQPAWIELRIENGVGSATVVRNDAFPDREGRLLLKDLSPDGDEWRGQVYAERFEDYRDARVSLPAPDRMQVKVKVGFMSRTLEWNRVDAVPAK